MQLSLPVPIFPTAAVSTAGTGNNPATPGDPTATAGEPFDSFLVQDAPAEKPAADEPSSEAENAAAIMAASFWMPIAPVVNPPVVPTPSLTAGSTNATASASAEPDVTAAANTGDASAIIPSCFGPTSSRSFAAVRPAGFGAAFQKAVTTGSTATAASDVVAAENTGSVSPAIMPTTTPNVDPGIVAKNPPVATPGQASAVVPPLDAQFQNQGGFPTAQIKLPRGTPQAVTSVNVNAKTKAPAVETSAGIIASPEATTTTDSDGSPSLVSSKQTDVKSDVSDTAIDADGAASLTPDAVKEKIASLPPELNDVSKTISDVRQKYFLDPVQKAVTTVSSTVGIAVAKLNATMSAATLTRQKSSSLPESTAGFVFSTETTPTATLTIDAPAPVATVRETLAAVISAVDALERRADIQHKSVDLQFSVGSEKLGLRVELRDGTVHTTFRTESSEMNNALSREWHSVVQSTMTRDIRIADPVFNSSTSGGNDSSANLAGHGSPQQQREQPKAAPSFASALKREFYDSGASESAPTATPASNSSKLLNVLA